MSTDDLMTAERIQSSSLGYDAQSVWFSVGSSYTNALASFCEEANNESEATRDAVVNFQYKWNAIVSILAGVINCLRKARMDVPVWIIEVQKQCEITMHRVQAILRRGEQVSAADAKHAIRGELVVFTDRDRQLARFSSLAKIVREHCSTVGSILQESRRVKKTAVPPPNTDFTGSKLNTPGNSSPN